jgi:ferredoxin-NADP reductase
VSAVVDSGINGVLAAYRGYLNVFAKSPAAPYLSQPKPVRFTGFELELDVQSVEHVAEDVVAITLANGMQLPAWSPGAHLDLFLPSGAQRQYSLCGDREDLASYRIAVRRIADGGGGSREIHDQVRVGDTIRVRGPRNAFMLAPDEAYLFIAAGIGITPILAMVAEAERRGADWTLVYLGRSRETLPFLDELAAYGERVVVLTDDEHGLPDMGRVLAHAPEGASVYLCGPPVLVDQAKALLPTLDPTARLFSERFSAPPVRGGEPFTVRLARSATEVQVAADESALAAIRREIPSIAYSCQQGFCGTCKVTVLDGDVEHRDSTLLASERDDCMLTCVSRGAGTLVLDL